MSDMNLAAQTRMETYLRAAIGDSDYPYPQTRLEWFVLQVVKAFRNVTQRVLVLETEGVTAVEGANLALKGDAVETDEIDTASGQTLEDAEDEGEGGET